MTDYVVTGITQVNIFRVYTGTTPFNTVYYNTYPANTSYITLYNLPNNYTMYVVLEDTITNFRTTKYVRTASAYCGDTCYGTFFLDVTYPITPTPSITPSVTPTISLTPSISVSLTPSPTMKVALSPTPTITPTVSLSKTPAATPTPTPTPSVTINCGYYEVSFAYDFTFNVALLDLLEFTYLDCDTGAYKTLFIDNGSSLNVCMVEQNGIPIYSIPQGYAQYVTINRVSYCGS